jgi:hypothetical protein
MPLFKQKQNFNHSEHENTTTLADGNPDPGFEKKMLKKNLVKVVTLK